MYEQRKSLPSIEEYLRHSDTQEKIQRKIIEARSAATVTITRASEMFDFSDTQLRDWDNIIFASSPRIDGARQDDKKHRQYSRAQLDILAAIRILKDSDYSITEIKQNIATIRNVANQLGQEVFALPTAAERKQLLVETTQERSSVPPIDQLLDNADSELFWRFYIASALRLSLMLLHEDNLDTIMGLVLPLDSQIPASVSTVNIADLGPCLIGWLRPDLSFSLLYDPLPSFEQHTDFRMHPLQPMRSGFVQEDRRQDNTWLVVQRRALPLNISFSVLTAIRRLLAPLYQGKDDWLPIFSKEQYSFAFPATDFSSSLAYDVILPKLADLIVDLGHDKGWKFASILTPHDALLPVSQHKLVLQAKSKKAPETFETGTTRVSPLDEVISVSLRAYQGGRICYRHLYTKNDLSVVHAEDEQPIGSVIAIPIGGEEATPLGVIYLASSEQDAFDPGDQHVLRLMARIVQELLLTYQTRLQITKALKPLINNPALADRAFAPFSSETDFIADTEKLLRNILEREDLEPLLRPILELPNKKAQNAAMAPYYSTNDVVSFICFDINDQTNLTLRHGEIMRRNLSREVGRQAKGVLATLFTNINDWKLYQAYDDRYYVLLKGIPLEEARIKAGSLKEAIDGAYQIDALRFSTDQPRPPEMLVEENITVRVGASCYPALKLYELMQRDNNKPYPAESVTAIIKRDFDTLLKVGLGMEGKVASWDVPEWDWK